MICVCNWPKYAPHPIGSSDHECAYVGSLKCMSCGLRRSEHVNINGSLSCTNHDPGDEDRR